MTKSKDKNKILYINIFMQIVFCFFSVFFNIYVYEISKNLNIVILYTLTHEIFGLLLDAIILKLINKKFLSFMYKFSFILLLFCTLLTFAVNESRLYLVFIIQILYSATCLFYYKANEVGTMSKNKKSEMKKFVALNSSLSIFAAVLSPFLSGYIIDFVSYYVLFSIMIVCVAICFLFSINLNLVDNEVEHVSVKEFMSIANKDKGVRYGYLGYAIARFSQDGLIKTLLPILLFMRTGTNYSVGVYSSIAALLASLLLLIYANFAKSKKYVMWICSFFKIIASILILISNSIIIFFVYYFINNITTKLLHNDTYSSLFVLVNHTKLNKYKAEQHFVYHTYSVIALVVSCLLSLLLYNLVSSVINLSLFLVITSLFQIMSTYFILKSDKLLKNTKVYEYSKLPLMENNKIKE